MLEEKVEQCLPSESR